MKPNYPKQSKLELGPIIIPRVNDRNVKSNQIIPNRNQLPPSNRPIQSPIDPLRNSYVQRSTPRPASMRLSKEQVLCAGERVDPCPKDSPHLPGKDGRKAESALCRDRSPHRDLIVVRSRSGEVPIEGSGQPDVPQSVSVTVRATCRPWVPGPGPLVRVRRGAGGQGS